MAAYLVVSHGRCAAGHAARRAGAAKEQYTYRCVGKDGKKYYGQTIPHAVPRHAGRAAQQAGHGGEAHRSPRATRRRKLAKEEAAQKKRDAENAAKDTQRRRPRAARHLHQREGHRGRARPRAGRATRSRCEETQRRIAEIKKRKERYEKELELFKDERQGRACRPRLKEEISIADLDLKAQESVLDVEEEGRRAASTRATTRTCKRYRELSRQGRTK